MNIWILTGVRVEVKNYKTTEANYIERTKILYMWLGVLQQIGAKTNLPHWIVKLGNRVDEYILWIYRKMVYVLSSDGYVHAIE